MRRQAGYWGIVLLAISLAACGARGQRAEVDDQSRHVREPDQPFREVVAGDTLYSIAWENGRDYRELARWNDIDPPFLIKPGRRLRLHPPEPGAAASETTPLSENGHYRVVKGDTLYGIARRHGVDHQDLAKWNNLRPPYRIRPGQTLRLSAGRTGSTRATRRPGTPAKPQGKPQSTPVLSAGKVRWRWPTQGEVIARYTGTRKNKGIDIAGRPGQKILAAASGEVVYQGSGLRGYGRLVIIKHTEEFLSAYAHCDRIYVKEGDVLKTGTLIAGMGSSGTNRTKLHFEIRYRGNPVNPLKYLPRK